MMGIACIGIVIFEVGYLHNFIFILNLMLPIALGIGLYRFSNRSPAGKPVLILNKEGITLGDAHTLWIGLGESYGFLKLRGAYDYEPLKLTPGSNTRGDVDGFFTMNNDEMKILAEKYYRASVESDEDLMSKPAVEIHTIFGSSPDP